MDDHRGGNMGSSTDGDKPGLLVLLFAPEDGAGDFAGPAQLSLRRLRSRQGLGMDLRRLAPLPSTPRRHACRRRLWFLWLWNPVASRPQDRLLALFHGIALFHNTQTC